MSGTYDGDWHGGNVFTGESAVSVRDRLRVKANAYRSTRGLPLVGHGSVAKALAAKRAGSAKKPVVVKRASGGAGTPARRVVTSGPGVVQVGGDVPAGSGPAAGVVVVVGGGYTGVGPASSQVLGGGGSYAGSGVGSWASDAYQLPVKTGKQATSLVVGGHKLAVDPGTSDANDFEQRYGDSELGSMAYGVWVGANDVTHQAWVWSGEPAGVRFDRNSKAFAKAARPVVSGAGKATGGAIRWLVETVAPPKKSGW